jgi:DNA-binding NarL/FixJ family response regulator
MGETGVNVLIAARNWWTREALLRVLEARGLEPVDEAAAADVAVVDVDEAEGPLLLAELRALEVPCVALSDRRGRVTASLAVAASFALKSELEPVRLADLVRLAAAGEALFVQAGTEPLDHLSETPAERYALTPRELDVLRLLAAGRTNLEIAGELHLARSSVKKLVSRVLVRLGVRNRVEAALVAQREGVVSGRVYW